MPLPPRKVLVFGQRRKEISFYNENESAQSVVVEKNLCASDLCQLLAMKNRVSKSVHWSIVECWTDLGLGEFIPLFCDNSFLAVFYLQAGLDSIRSMQKE
nr:unnamed protein product [Callosobruchus chinensis]